MQIRGYLARILGVVLVVIGLVACGTSADRPGAAPATEAGPAGTRTIVDMAGRSVDIPARVDRVATNYPALNQAIFLLGAADRIVATSQDMRASYPLFTTMYPRLKEIPTPFTSASAEANVEELLAARPDVVFLSSGSKALLPTMDRLHIPTLIFDSFKDPDELKAGVALAANVLGGNAVARADEFAAYYDANVKRVHTATDEITQDSRPKVYYTAGNPLQTEGKGQCHVA